MEFADDAALGNTITDTASIRMTNLDSGSAEAGMSISKPKTKAQHIRHRPKVAATMEADIANLPMQDLLHKGKWCKGRKALIASSRK